MIQGTIDLTENRDFMNDKVPGKMEGINPDKLFKADKKTKSTFKSKQEELSYHLMQIQNSFETTTTSTYNFRIYDNDIFLNTSSTINWREYNNWEYTNDVYFNDNYDALRYSLSTYYGYKFKDKRDELFDRLPWADDNNKKQVIRSVTGTCPDHGVYIRPSSQLYRTGIACKKCYLENKNEQQKKIPWSTKKDLWVVKKDLYLKKLIRGIPENFRSIELPWFSKYYYKKHGTRFEDIPWLKNMTGRALREYKASLYDDDNEDEDFDMNRYLNMSPHGNTWY